METTYKGHLVIIVALEHYNPLGLLRTFGEAGIAPIFVGINYKVPVASACKYIQKGHHADTIQESYDIVMSEYGDIGEQDPSKKPFLIFADDDVYSCFEEHYDEVMARFITFNAGEKGRVTYFMQKKAIIDCAERHGIPVLKSIVVPTGQIPNDLTYPVITKAISPIVGAWKGDFHVCENEEQLRESMASITADEILIQPYVDKKCEIAFEGFSYNHGTGMYTGVECRYLYAIKGYYSPLHETYYPKHEELRDKLNAMLAEIGFEGLWEIEFLVDKNDNLWFLEVNFRNSPWSYGSSIAGNPLPILWCDAMLAGECREPKKFESFISMVEPVDFAKRVEEGRCSLPEWLTDFKRAKCTYYYNENDMEPWNLMVANWEKLK